MHTRAVIIGVGQLRANREKTVAGAREPADLIAEALRRAALDSGVGPEALLRAQRLDLVRVTSWDYDDLAGDISWRLGIAPSATSHDDVGGNRPPLLVDQAAARIASGEIDVALIAGGESAASVASFAKAGVEPTWERRPGGHVKFPREISGTELAIKHHLTRPIRAYPLYENALRAALGQTFDEAQQWSAEIYADFTTVAATNPAAWNPTPLLPPDISTVSDTNRMICHPYPLLMNALGTVDQAAAVIVTSEAVARELGVPQDRLVHVWGGAGGVDSRDILSRVSYDHAPAMNAVLDVALEQAEVEVEDLDVIDLYSCFPCVPKLASRHLGLPRGARLSATGGLTAFGGPGNNYSLHAVAAVVGQIRDGRRLGLVYGNGELVTKHHALLLGANPHAADYIGKREPVSVGTETPPALIEHAAGRATVETFTVEYSRGGEPTRGFVIGRVADGARFVANTADGDRATLASLVDEKHEPIGGHGVVSTAADGRNIFAFDAASRP